MATQTAETESQKAATRLEQTNPDYDPNVVIETQNLTKIYRDFWGRQKVRALNALDLEIRKGEIFGLLGPNGSGKSTTIKLLLGPAVPDQRPGVGLWARGHRSHEKRAYWLSAGRIVSI